MRPGPARGTTAQRDLVVDASMTDTGLATGMPGELPGTLGTLALAGAITAVARDLLAEHLEDGEIAVPGRLEIVHRVPVPVGATVLLEATVQMVEPSRVTCEVLVRTAEGVAARTSYEQEIVPLEHWLDRMGTMVA
jgi:predicted thioesterase